MPDLPDVTHEEITTFSGFYPTHPRDKAWNMSKALNAYAHCFSWQKVVDLGVISRKTLYSYFKCPLFIKAVDNLGPIALQRAVDVYHEALQDAPWPERIKAADRITQRYDANWDPGVRRMRESVKGSAALEVFKSKLTPERMKEIDAKDPFSSKESSKLSDNVSYQSQTTTKES